MKICYYSIDFFCKRSITYPVTKLNSRYLNLNFPEQGLVCIKSGKGTGKTENLIKLIQESMGIGRKVLVISHRIQLGRSICKRLGLVWVEDQKENPEDSIFGFGLYIDSLHTLSQAKFNPSEWEDAIIILDEVEQIIWHLLNSSTCTDKRAILCRMFMELMQTVLGSDGLVVAQDADLRELEAEGHIIELSEFEKTSLECERLLGEVLDPLAEVPEFTEQLKGTVQKLHHLEQTAKNHLEKATETRDKNQYSYAKFIAAQFLVSRNQYEELKSKRKKTQDELAQQRHYEISYRYGVEVSPELVLRDMAGDYPKLRLHYYLLHPDLVHQRDKHHLQKQLEAGEGKVCLQDIKLLSAQVQVLQLLGVEHLLNPDAEFTLESEEILEFADKVITYSRDMRDYLGISPDSKASPIRIVQDVLRNKIGLPLKCVRQIKLPDGTRQRVYAFDCPTWRYSIFDHWLERDLLREQEGTPQSINNIEVVVSDVPESESAPPAGESELLKRFWTQFWNLFTCTDWKPRLRKLLKIPQALQWVAEELQTQPILEDIFRTLEGFFPTDEALN